MKNNNQIMGRGYNKEEALTQMRQLRNLIEMAQLLKFKTIQDIAVHHGVSTQALYNNWEEATGKRWSEGLDIEVRIYKPVKLPEKNKKS